MKPAPFKYHAPDSLEEALALLGDFGEEAKILAGGQSLIPAMNFRIAQPGILVDLNRLHALSFVEAENENGLRIGAMARQREIETHTLVKSLSPLLHETMPNIAHVQIRNRGTMGGSIAHADPAAELPAVMLALQAEFCLQNQNQQRWVAAQDFFVGMFATALAPGELLSEIRIAALPAHSGWAFEEMARRHGDYALVGVAVAVTLDEKGACRHARIALLSVGDGPVLAVQGGQTLLGQKPNTQMITETARIVAQKDIDPGNDIHASADFRRHLATVLTERALKRAFAVAESKQP